jgi:hypothetical protein
MEVAIGGDTAKIERYFLYCKPSFIDCTYFKPLKEILKPATGKDFSEFSG